jgi:hypothetical protein
VFIKVSILGVLIARMVYLAQVFIPGVSLKYQLWTQVWPPMGQTLCILFVCQYKMHLYYLSRQEVASKRVKVCFMVGYFTLVMYAFIMPIMIAKSDQLGQFWWLNNIASLVTLGPLSIFSLYSACKLINEL